MQRGSALLAGLVAALGAAPALAAPAAHDIAFVSEFADACVPERGSFAGTEQTALGAGWTVVGAEADPELAVVMQLSDDAAKAMQPQGGELAYATYAKPIDGVPHYLVVSRAALKDADGKRQSLVGCYLYNFAAAAAVDPEAVDALIGAPATQSQVDMHISSYQWNAPAKLPGTLDVYLTFVPEVSQYKEQTGFSGLVLQFNTSESDAEAGQS